MKKKIDDWTKEIEKKEGLPAGTIADIIYQTICKGGFTFDELAKWLKKAM